ncbi:MAG TPA: hypothetical protein VFV58_04225 [Blastocatellia bacterium]|jgi:hypothetical protein|nr:hypothetical protein [Blastocatellia bacterium]
MAARKNAVAYMVGFLIVILGQSYVALAFAAMIIESARPMTGRATGLVKWFLWALAVFVASEPGAIAVKSIASHHNEPDANPLATSITSQTALLTSSVNFFGSIVFAMFPSAVSWGWGWVPHL